MKPLQNERILLTNDDGIHAPGLETLARIAGALSDDVWIVAPESEQSGASHSLTLHEPLRVRELEERRFAVWGTPTDCVVMAVHHVMKDNPPTLVLSGVNRGANVADDVTYSGTIAGAMEGTVLGVPSIALSQTYGWEHRNRPPWETAEEHGPELIARLWDIGWQDHVLMNVNFPDCAPDEVTGIEVTVQGKRDASALKIIEREDGRGIPYFWLGFQPPTVFAPEAGTDRHALWHKRISVTPLHMNLTEPGTGDALAEALKADQPHKGDPA
jgi:5'-nucleotidase